MIKSYDVIIVGAGPAGLRCAQVLSKSDLSVLLLEKNPVFGDKVCAGGLTRKSMEILGFPDEVIEHKITQTALFSRKRKSQTNAPEPFLFTVKRKEFGEWQKGLLKDTHIDIRNNAKVTKVEDHKLTVNNIEEIGFKFLVGADGYNSIIRRHLKLPMEKKLIGIQYRVKTPNLNPRLEIHLNSRLFGPWYAWSFPHEGSIAVGTICDPKKMSAKKLKENLLIWLKEQNINVGNAVFESAPIAFDYRGYDFNPIFLIGEAAGFASGLTGEGIYQSLVSGEAAALKIVNKKEAFEDINAVIKYNAVQHKMLNIFGKSGFLLAPIQELIVMLLNNNWVKGKINKSFS